MSGKEGIRGWVVGGSNRGEGLGVGRIEGDKDRGNSVYHLLLLH